MSEGAQHTILVDTNVWIDLFWPQSSNPASTVDFFSAAAKANIALLYPAGIAKDVFYKIEQMIKKASREQAGELSDSQAIAARQIAWSCLENMRELATAVGVDESDLWLACKYRGFNSDFEDNLVLAAAERAHADYLVTLDRRLQRKSSVPALSPADMTALIHMKHS